MIDIESELFTIIAAEVRSEYPGIFISGEYVRQPPSFPAVSVMEMDNSVMRSGRDSGAIENFADVMYQVDVYSNRVQGKKTECKAIIKLIDAQMENYGFTRTFLQQTPNFEDATIYRMTGRYQATVGKDNYIYNRR